MSKKRIIKIVDIAFWTIMLIGTVFSIYNSYWLRPMSKYSFIDTFFKCILLIIICLAIRIALSKAYTSKLSEVDLKNDNYYRNILHKYSPAVLKYIDNFEYKDNVIIVILMGLKLKGIINNELEIIDNDLSKLDLNEKYICVNLDKLKDIDVEQLKHTIIYDCKNYGIIKDYKRKNIHDISYKLAVGSGIGVILITTILGIMKYYMLIILLVALIIITVVTYAVYNIAVDELDEMNPYIRTRKGDALNEKLEGLRKYLADYSSLDTKSKEELAIWEDYLIYSVMFEQNEKIIKQYQEKIDRI